MVKNIVRVCAQNYSGFQFTALSRGPIPGHSPVPSTVPQGTGETISTDHAGVRPRNRNCGPAVNPETYVT